MDNQHRSHQGPTIRALNLRKYYGSGVKRVPVLDGVEFTIPGGGLFAVRGPNGSGKSTLIKMICGVALQNGGELRVGNLAPQAYAACRCTGLLLEGERSFFWRLSARRNLSFFAALFGLPHRRLSRRLDQLTADWQATAWIDRPVAALSAGQRKRLALMRALLDDHPLLLLDDPLSGLDGDGIAILKQTLQSVHRRGVTTVFTGHQQDALTGAEQATITLAAHLGGVPPVDGALGGNT